MVNCIVLFVELLIKIKFIEKKKKERKRKRILESEKFFIVESGILGFGIRNTAQRIRSESEFKFHCKDRNPCQYHMESRIQDCIGFSFMRWLSENILRLKASSNAAASKLTLKSVIACVFMRKHGPGSEKHYTTTETLKAVFIFLNNLQF